MPSLKQLLQKPLLKLSLSQFNCLLAAWLTLGLNIYFFKILYHLSGLGSLLGLAFLAASILLVFAYYLLIIQLISWRITAKTIASVLIVIGGWSSYFVTNLGINIDQGQITNLMQTDSHEALDLMSAPWLLWTFATIILPLCVVWKIQLKPQPVRSMLLGKLLGIIAALVIAVGSGFIFYNQYAPIFREHRDLKSKLSPLNSLSSLSSYTKKQFKSRHKALVSYGTDAKLTRSSNLPKLFVLVVGETGRAESFSLNGYAKNTNPELAQLDILNFKQVSSCGTATAVSVPCMFSGMPRHNYDADLASHREGLLDIAQRAGYQVTWIDNNSGCKGVCERTGGQYPVPEALKQQWCKEGECYDDLLLSSLTHYLQQLQHTATPKNQLIVLHQVGSHGPAYFKRYPEQFRHFSPTCDTNSIQTCSREALINTYDNSIVYTDHVLASLIGQLKQLSGFQSAMWYLSDHGESTGEHGLYLHGAPYMLAPSQQTHVPMIMWFSQAWQQQAPALVPCLKRQLDQPRSQDNLFPTVLSLLDIQTKVLDGGLDMRKGCKG